MRNRAENQVKLVFIRHGATKSNKEHRYLGRTEEGLWEAGKRELLQAKKEERYPQVTHLFVSPMKRCLETAQILYPEIAPIIIPEWAEMDFGAFEGKNYMELQKDRRYQAWIDSNGTLPFPEGESREAFTLRCDGGFRRMLAYLSESGAWNQRSLVVGMIVHGGTIMSLLSQYSGGDYFDYQVANGGGYLGVFKERGGAPAIVDVEKF